MPALPLLLLLGGFGAGFFTGAKTNELLTLVVIGGVAYYVIKGK